MPWPRSRSAQKGTGPSSQLPGCAAGPRSSSFRSPAPRAQARCGSAGCLPCRWPQLRSRLPASLQYMEKLSQLAYHPLKMQSCYEKMEPLRLDGLQQRFDVSSTSVFKQRAQIHMREVGQRLLPAHPSALSLPQPPSPGRVPTPGRTLLLCALQPRPAPRAPLLRSRVFGTPVPLFTWLTRTHLSGLSLETPPSMKPSLLPKPLPVGPRTSVSYFLEAGTAHAQPCASTG